MGPSGALTTLFVDSSKCFSQYLVTLAETHFSSSWYSVVFQECLLAVLDAAFLGVLLRTHHQDACRVQHPAASTCNLPSHFLDALEPEMQA